MKLELTCACPEERSVQPLSHFRCPSTSCNRLWHADGMAGACRRAIRATPVSLFWLEHMKRQNILACRRTIHATHVALSWPEWHDPCDCYNNKLWHTKERFVRSIGRTIHVIRITLSWSECIKLDTVECSIIHNVSCPHVGILYACLPLENC